jgi:hypothetical protein
LGHFLVSRYVPNTGALSDASSPSSSIGPQDPISNFFDNTFDGAHNLTVEAGDLKNVRWARIDYLEVTDITTRWGIWKSAYISFSPLLSLF